MKKIMPEEELDLSLCIVNWNTVLITLLLIKSIYDTINKSKYEIIVVDNNSIDESVERIKKEYPKVKIIENIENRGYGAALNQALKVSKGRYKLILNSNVILMENAVDCMVSSLDKNQKWGAVGPICLDVKKEITYSYGHFPRIWLMIMEEIFGRIVPKIINNPPLEMKPFLAEKENMEVEYIKGCCILVRREVINEIGLFDENYFAYYEETDWCYRMKKKGIKRILIGDARIIHIYDASFSQMPEMKNQLFENSKRHYLKKHFGVIIYKIYIVCNTIGKIRHSVKVKLLSVFNRKKP